MSFIINSISVYVGFSPSSWPVNGSVIENAKENVSVNGNGIENDSENSVDSNFLYLGSCWAGAFSLEMDCSFCYDFDVGIYSVDSSQTTFPAFDALALVS